MIFVGDGPDRGTIETEAISLGIQDRVHFVGLQRDVRPAILAARATVLASSQEGLPRAVMESLSCGVPVVGSDIRGTRDLVSKDVGLLFPTGDIAALASCLDWFAQNDDEARVMGLRATDLMTAYDVRHIIALHEGLYNQAKSSANQSD